MKYLFLQLATLGSAFILPNEQVQSLRHVTTDLTKLECPFQPPKSIGCGCFNHVGNKIKKFSAEADEAFTAVVDEAYDRLREYNAEAEKLADDVWSSLEDVESTFESQIGDMHSSFNRWTSSLAEDLEQHQPESFSTWSATDHRHHKPNRTVYQLISESKYTKKLAKLVDEYPDLVKALNGTAANYTLFAPTDSAFHHFPHKGGPSKDEIESILKYHVSPEFYPVGRVLTVRTIPTLYKSPKLGKDGLPQRLSTKIGLKGVYINYLTRVIGVDKFATNGVVHLVNSFIIPPPGAAQLLNFAPTYFSTLQLGLMETGLYDEINSTKTHKGGTLFAPSNSAFQKLSPALTGFLFSKYGRKYLKALLAYHVVPNATLYSDAYYKPSSIDTTAIPKGRFHIDLETLLEKRTLSIDIARWGRLISVAINGYDYVDTTDLVVADGVIHVLGNILFPPKKLSSGEFEDWDDKTEMTVDELKDRLEPYITETEYDLDDDDDDDHWEDL